MDKTLQDMDEMKTMSKTELSTEILQRTKEADYQDRQLSKLILLSIGSKILLNLPDALQKDGRIILELEDQEETLLQEYQEEINATIPQAKHEYEILMEYLELFKEISQAVIHKEVTDGKYINKVEIEEDE